MFVILVQITRNLVLHIRSHKPLYPCLSATYPWDRKLEIFLRTRSGPMAHIYERCSISNGEHITGIKGVGSNSRNEEDPPVNRFKADTVLFRKLRRHIHCISTPPSTGEGWWCSQRFSRQRLRRWWSGHSRRGGQPGRRTGSSQR